MSLTCHPFKASVPSRPIVSNHPRYQWIGLEQGTPGRARAQWIGTEGPHAIIELHDGTQLAVDPSYWRTAA